VRRILFLRPWKDYLSLPRTGEYRIAQAMGLLAQTRGCGTPPPLVVIAAKKKFLDTVTSPPGPLPEGVRELWVASLEKILGDAPDEAFTGLQTKTGIRVTASACLESTRKDGGTADAINKIVSDAGLGRPCYTIDLETGGVTGKLDPGECTPGEYIFWRCLEIVLSTEPEQLRHAYLLLVREPGKARAVTKAMAALKVVLDLVNGWVSWPLGKAFPSSTSGMQKESHGWNFFKAMSTDEEVVLRAKSSREEPVTLGVVKKLLEYYPVFVSSTDYTTATDFLRHDLGETVGNGWMLKCGVPAILRGVVIATCYRPRTITFHATGCLEGYGEPTPGGDTRQVVLRRGILMGDPLTKVVLHLVNILVRTTATLLIKGGDSRIPTIGLPRR